MQITDASIIEAKKDSAGELQDGLVVFVGQGSHVIEMIAHHASDWSMYEVQLHARPDRRANELYEIDSFLQLDSSQLDYELLQSEYFDNAPEAHARFAALIVQHNHF